jgi:hypothetical protein
VAPAKQPPTAAFQKSSFSLIALVAQVAPANTAPTAAKKLKKKHKLINFAQ